MNANLKSKLVALPLLALSTITATAGPVALNRVQMDGVTAGSQPVFERIASLLTTLPQTADEILNTEELAKLVENATQEILSFQQLGSGEKIATYPLASGEKLVFVKQVADVDPASRQQAGASESVKTYLLKPGESLSIEQHSVGGGSNHLYVYSQGSSVTTIQKSGF